jgi:hypothetical protein
VVRAKASGPESQGGDDMSDTHVTITGNLTADPELTFTPNERV